MPEDICTSTTVFEEYWDQNVKRLPKTSILLRNKYSNRSNCFRKHCMKASKRQVIFCITEYFFYSNKVSFRYNMKTVDYFLVVKICHFVITTKLWNFLVITNISDNEKIDDYLLIITIYYIVIARKRLTFFFYIIPLWTEMFLMIGRYYSF